MIFLLKENRVEGKKVFLTNFSIKLNWIMLNIGYPNGLIGPLLGFFGLEYKFWIVKLLLPSSFSHIRLSHKPQPKIQITLL